MNRELVFFSFKDLFILEGESVSAPLQGGGAEKVPIRLKALFKIENYMENGVALFYTATWWKKRLFPCKGINPIMRTPPSWFNPTLFTSQRPHFQIPLHWGLGLQHKNFEGTQTLVHSSYPLYLGISSKVVQRVPGQRIASGGRNTDLCLGVKTKKRCLFAITPLREGTFWKFLSPEEMPFCNSVYILWC